MLSGMSVVYLINLVDHEIKGIAPDVININETYGQSPTNRPGHTLR